MKKVLALVLAFAVCFTAIAGCLAVSADTPTIAIADNSVSAAGGSATITVSGSNYSDQYAQILAITVPQAITVNSITGLTEYDAQTPDGDFDWLRTVDGSGNTVIKILDIIDNAAFTYTINVTAPQNETYEDVDYTISATVEAADWQTETLADITIAPATFTVEAAAAPHVHAAAQDAEWLTDATNHWHVCAEHADVVVDQAAHTFDEGVVTEPTTQAGGYTTYTCTVCGYSYQANQTDPIHVHAAAQDAQWLSDTTNHWHVCAAGDEAIVDQAAHTFDAGVVTEPTTEAGGYTTYTCTVCGYSYQANQTDPIVEECEHVWEFVSATPATHSNYVETAKGSITLRCTECGEEVTEQLSFNLYSSLLTPSIDAGAETKLLFSTRRDLLERNGAPEATFIVIEQTYASGAKNTMVKTVADAQVSVDGSSRTVYTFPVGVPGKMMSDNFTGFVYTCVNGNWYNGYATSTSIKESAMNVITGSTPEALKNLCANLLVMGSVAQTYFNYNTENLADSELVGDYAQYIDNTVPTLVKDSENFNNGYQAGEVGFRTPSLAMEDAIKINYSVLTSTYKGSEDLQNLKVVFTYEGTSGATITEETTDLTAITNGYSFQFGVAARYMTTPVTATVYNGEVPVSAGVIFSVESLLKTAVDANKSDAALVALANAIINYSNAAKVAFAQ